MTYLDWAATTPPDSELLHRSLEESIELYGNPSSPHRPGKAAKILLEDARSRLLALLSPRRAERKRGGTLVFTASGTEADQIPMLALLRNPMRGNASTPAGQARPHLVISAIEHAAIFAQAETLARLGFDLTLVRPNADGILSAATVAEAIRPSTKLVAAMAVNNETGAIQDIGAIGDALVSAAASLGMPAPLFHVDCVQALGKIPLDLSSAKITSAAFSAHKLQGPKGVGALWCAKPIEALASGGGQESGTRSGTENLFGISAFAACASKAISALETHREIAFSLEDRLLRGIRCIPGASVLPLGRMPRDSRWSPWIVSAAFPGLGGEVLARALSDLGIAVSTGSACSHTRAAKGRRILDAMGVPEPLAFSAIRISVGPTTRPEDIDLFLSSAEDLYRALKT